MINFTQICTLQNHNCVSITAKSVDNAYFESAANSAETSFMKIDCYKKKMETFAVHIAGISHWQCLLIHHEMVVLFLKLQSYAPLHGNPIEHGRTYF